MLSIGLTEMLVVGAVALVVVGPERLPHLFRDAGRWYGKIRRMADELRRAFVFEADRQDAEDRRNAMKARREEVMARREADAKRLGETLPTSTQQEQTIASPTDADLPLAPKPPPVTPEPTPRTEAGPSDPEPTPVVHANDRDPNEPHPALLERMKKLDAIREGLPHPDDGQDHD